jgi:hypothetical protein
MQTPSNRARQRQRPGPTGRGRAGVVAVLAAALVALAATGCASDGGRRGGVASLNGGNANQAADKNASKQKDAQQGAIDFARCMREHGIDMPDPVVERNGPTKFEVRGRGKPGDPKKAQDAHRACQHHLQNGGQGPPRLDPKMQDQMLKFARCMRQHGIDMPDPTPQGGLVFRSTKGDAESPKFRAAERACESLMPKPDKTDNAGGTR